MKLTTNKNGIVLEEVFSGLSLKTRDGEYMGICMRDTGFEFNYQGIWYEAKQGIVRKLNENSDFSFLESNEHMIEKNKEVNGCKIDLIKWKYNKMTRTYESDNFLIVKKIAYWGNYFDVIRKCDNERIKTGVKKLSQAKSICEIFLF